MALVSSLPDDEIRRRILALLDRYYEEDFSEPVSVDHLATELNLDRLTIDRHLSSLRGKGFVEINNETAGGHYYVCLTPEGKDQWDRIQGRQHHLVIRRRILEKLKQVDDQDRGELTSSDALATELGADRNSILINLLALKQTGWVELQEQFGAGYPYFEARLTPEGRVAAEEPPLDINLCFVLMPFEVAFDPVYEAIKAGAENAHMQCERADAVRDNQAVIEKIKKSIQRAGLIVADMTDNNPNVFYEIGYAHGLGKECLLITQTPSENAPFDLRHLEHIKYSTDQQGLTTLTRALAETIVRVRSRGL